MEVLFFLLVPILVLLASSVLLLSRRTPPFMDSWRHKHVFVSGGSSGIGLAIARLALLEGAFVSLVSRSSSNLREAVDLLVKETNCRPDRIRFLAADVGDYSAISAAVKAALDWKPIDILVCNAGLTRGGYLENTQVDDLDTTIRTNLNGTIYQLHAALPFLKERSVANPVSIVIISSMASLFFLYGHAVYTSTKYALRGLAEGLRAELVPYNNIRVNLICPGFVNTPFLDDATKDSEVTTIMQKVNLLDRKNCETPESVAVCTLEAVKRGCFVVVTQPIGISLLMLARGLMPADNVWKVVFELISMVPFRLLSIKWACDIRRNILQNAHNSTK